MRPAEDGAAVVLVTVDDTIATDVDVTAMDVTDIVAIRIGVFASFRCYVSNEIID